MGLWGNMEKRVTDTLCKNVIANLLNLPKLNLPLQVSTPKLPLTLPMNKLLGDNVPKVGGLGGLLKKDETTESLKHVLQVTKKQSNSKRSGGGGLGSFLGGL